MKIFPAAGLFTIIASWCLLLGSIHGLDRRDERQPRGAGRHVVAQHA